jgi:hypothetical protein
VSSHYSMHCSYNLNQWKACKYCRRERKLENIKCNLSYVERRNLSLIRQLARIRLKPIIGIVTVYTVKRSNGKQQRLAIITIILILLQMMLFGYLTIFSLYLYGQPLCLDALNVSLISSVQAIVVFLLSMLTAVCKKSFERTYWSPALGALAFIVNLIILSLAKRIWLVYIG